MLPGAKKIIIKVFTSSKLLIHKAVFTVDVVFESFGSLFGNWRHCGLGRFKMWCVCGGGGSNVENFAQKRVDSIFEGQGSGGGTKPAPGIYKDTTP